MLLMKSKLLMGLALSAFLCSVGFAQPAAQNWKDRAEYDLYQEILKVQGAKQLELLEQWKQKYPETDFKLQRLGLYIGAYGATSKAKEMYSTSKEYLALDTTKPPNLMVVGYVVQMAVAQGEPDMAEKSANQLLGMLGEKPAAVTDAAWPAQQKYYKDLAKGTLYALVLAKKDPVLTEEYLKKEIQADPTIASNSYAMGVSIIAQKKVARYPEAFWHIARASALNGPGALPDGDKKKAAAYIEKNYIGYKGSKKDLDKLIASSLAEPFPPSGFAIKTVQEELNEEEEELKKTNPQLALWIAVKKALVGAEGDTYFKDSVKDSAVPPMKGKVLSHKPAIKPKEIVVAVADATTPEITIIIAEGGTLPGKADPGTEIEFESVAKAFTKEPFMMTVEVESNKIKGWPTPIPASAPGAKKAGPAVKKVTPKKK